MSIKPSHSHPFAGHEGESIKVKWVVVVLVGLFVSAIAMHFILAGFLSSLNRMPPSTDAWQPVRHATGLPPARPAFPMLQVSPPLDLRQFLQREQEELESYGWVDRQTGIVRVPIERAMDLVLQEGLPVRTNVNNNEAGPSEDKLTRDRQNYPHDEIKGGYR